jgi:ATP-binding cassette, subfamily B, multidrug efflux pump
MEAYMSEEEYRQSAQRRSGGQGHGPGMRGFTGEKAKNGKKSLKDLFNYLKPYYVPIIVALVLAAASAVFNVIGPGKISDITDLITDGIMSSIDIDAVVKICITLSVLYGLGWLFGYIQNFIMATVTQKVAKSLRSDISNKINRLPLRYFDSNSYGNVLSRVTNDVDTIAQTLNNSVGSLISSVTLLFGALAMMFVTNWQMALAAIGASFVGFILMMLIMGRSQKYFLSQQNDLGTINGHIEETYSGHQVVKTYNGEEKAEKTFDEVNERLYNNAWKSQFFSGLMMPIMGFIGNFGYVVVCVLGAVLAADGKITFGVIVSFMIYIRLFTQPLSQLAQVFTSLQSTMAAGERVFQFLSEKELEDEKDKTKVLQTVQGDIEFRNVHFGYSPEKTIINDFSAKAKAGQKIAIVGPTGAGKTTIVNLLMRFYETDSGEILIDEVPTKELTRENVHSLFCMVLQDTWLFEGTLRENLVYSNKGVSEERLNEAVRAVGLEQYIKTLPKGYDTVLDEQTSLSAGQRQLVTIARAMLTNSPLLILDEATSSVDTKTELAVQKAMDKLTEGRTSFVIAHRLSTIKNADLILVMKDGDIIEKGSHEELLSKGGFYHDLYNSQFENAS